MINNIIFDFDGVLVDSEILVAKSFTKYLNESGFDFKEKEFSEFAGLKTVEVISILSEKFSIKNEKKFHNDIMNIAGNIYSHELKSVIGSYDFIKDSNLELYIGSNSYSKRILEGLKKVNFDKFFNFNKIYSFDMVNKPKPFPDIYLKAINDNHLIKNETLIIEDSSVGVKAGVAAGVKVVGITAGSHWYNERSNKELFESGAIEVVNSYSELNNLIESY